MRTKLFLKQIIYGCLLLSYIQNLYIFIIQFHIDDIQRFGTKILFMIVMYVILSGFIVVLPFIVMIPFFILFLKHPFTGKIIKTGYRLLIHIFRQRIKIFYSFVGLSILVNIICFVSPEMNMLSSVLLGCLYAVFVNDAIPESDGG